MPHVNLSTIGNRGLVMFYESKYYYVEESKWRDGNYKIPSTSDLKGLQGLLNLNVIVAKLEKQAFHDMLSEEGVFVDLDGFSSQDTPPRTQQKTSARASHAPATPCTIVLHEASGGVDNFYKIPSADWEELTPAGAEGDAGVLIRRGAILANIPKNDIPFGTYCILVDVNHILDPGAPNDRDVASE